MLLTIIVNNKYIDFIYEKLHVFIFFINYITIYIFNLIIHIFNIK